MDTAQWTIGDDELQKAFKEFNTQQFRFRGIANKEKSSPLPQWLKDSDLIMMNINPAYEQVFDVRASDYVGNTDHAVWPDDVSARFREHDRMVLDADRVLHFTEIVPHPESGEDWPLYVIKYPVHGDDFLGVGGACVPLEWILKSASEKLGKKALCELIG